MATQRHRTRGRVIGRERISYANVMATLAVFIALGGSAWALKANSVGPRELQRNAVRARHVKKRQIRTRHIKDGAVTRSKLADGLRGEPGPRGPAGQTGPRGPEGPKGDPAWVADCNQGLPADDVMVRVGPVCIDRYEASIWDARSGGNQLDAAEVTALCPVTGQDCKDKIFARSVAGATPATGISWFQAQQALANSGKRLPSNAEWQMAVSGTPDHPGPCNTDAGLFDGPDPAGSSAGCISDWGVNDMVGNVSEWVADWDEEGVNCSSTWLGGDRSCVGRGSGDASTDTPGPFYRGGSWSQGAVAGPFAIRSDCGPSATCGGGFRGAR